MTIQDIENRIECRDLFYTLQEFCEELIKTNQAHYYRKDSLLSLLHHMQEYVCTSNDWAEGAESIWGNEPAMVKEYNVPLNDAIIVLILLTSGYIVESEFNTVVRHYIQPAIDYIDETEESLFEIADWYNSKWRRHYAK